MLLSGYQSKQLSKMSDTIMERYIQCISRIAGDETVISYVRNNIDCIWKAKPVYLHGDFHPSLKCDS